MNNNVVKKKRGKEISIENIKAKTQDKEYLTELLLNMLCLKSSEHPGQRKMGEDMEKAILKAFSECMNG